MKSTLKCKIMQVRLSFYLFSLVLILIQPFSIQISAQSTKAAIYANKTIQSEKTTKLNGTVTDEKGEAIIGANIIINGTNSGTITDLNGTFKIDAQIGSQLRISYLGYESQIVNVSLSKILKIILNPNSKNLDEVVVVGYGTQKKESVVGSISQVKGEALVNSGTKTMTNALSGVIPGLVVTQNNGQPGKDNASLLIRGRSSWTDGSPLVLVDGIERSMSEIDPNEVQTLTVLKDASATAVYGTQGANGVIIVTTKRGFEGKPKMSYSFNQGFKTPTSRPSYVDSYTTHLYANEAKKNDNNWAGLKSQNDLELFRNQSDPLFHPSVDWGKALLKEVAYSTDMNLNISGGTDKLKYFASLGYLKDGDLLNTQKIGDLDARFYSNRYNIRTNLDYAVSKYTTISLNVGGSFKQVNSPAINVTYLYRGIYITPPDDSPLVYEPWVLEKYPDKNEPNAVGLRYPLGSTATVMNPYSQVYTNGGFSKDNYSDGSIDLNLKQNLDFITKGLSFSGIVSYNVSSAYSDTYTISQPTYNLQPNGTWTRYVGLTSDNYTGSFQPLYYANTSGLSKYTSSVRKLYYETRLNYAKKINKHDLALMAVFKRNQVDVIGNSSSVNQVEEPRKTEDWAGRITYNYDLRYLFEVNLGYSGSDQFAPKNRFGFFPAFAIGWNLANEVFIKNSKLSFINNLKTRFTWGKVGKAAGARWLYYQSDWVNGTAPGYGGLGGESYWNTPMASYDEGAIANYAAQWEVSIKKNLGFEVGIFENLFTLNVDLFDENRDNILMVPTNLIPSWGVFSTKDQNIGKTKNHGYEIDLMYNKRFSNGFRYFVGGNMSFNENRIVFRDDAQGTPFYQTLAGKPIDTKNDFIRLPYYQSVDDINNYISPSGADQLVLGDEKFMDYNADGIIDAKDRVPFEFQLYPRYDYSIRTGFEYKKFTFSIMVQGNEDKNILMYQNNSPFGLSATGISRIQDFQFNHYTTETPNGIGSAYHYSGTVVNSNNEFNGGGVAGRLLPSDYIRLKQVEMSYNLENKFLKKQLINSIQIFANANNIMTFSPLRQKFVDPEKTTYLLGNADYSYPMARRFNVGCKVNF